MVTMVATGLPPISNLIASFLYLANANFLEVADFAIFMIMFSLIAPVFSLGALRYAGIEFVNSEGRLSQLQMKIVITVCLYLLSVLLFALFDIEKIGGISALLLPTLIVVYNLFETLRLIVVGQRMFLDLLKINLLFSFLNVTMTFMLLNLVSLDPNSSRILSLIIAYLLPSFFIYKFLVGKFQIHNFVIMLQEARRLTKLGIPIMLGALPFWFITNSDRLVLKHLGNLELLGVLGSAYLLANLTTIIIQAFVNHITGEYIKKLQEFSVVQNRRFLSKLLMVCLSWYVPVAALYYFILRQLDDYGIISLESVTFKWLLILLFAGLFKIFVSVSSLYNDTVKASGVRFAASFMTAVLLAILIFPIILIEKPELLVGLPIIGSLSISIFLYFGTERYQAEYKA